MARQIRTPALDDEFSKAGARTYWKRVLPLADINYRDKTGKARVIEFNDAYLADVQNSFAAGALDNRSSAPFVLADKDNAHTMDPERYRGDVTALVRESELPEDIAAAITAREGRLPAGLYGRVEFASKKAAKAVVSNPHLPVSMRIREGMERSDGKNFGAVPIHLLGTMDPKVPGLGGWVPATADLAEYASDDIVDLSGETYVETTVAKNKTSKSKTDVQLGSGTATVEVPNIDDVTEDDIAKWDDATLNAFLAQYAPEDSDGEPGDGSDSADDDDEGDATEDEGGGDTEAPEATLSNTANADIEFANAQVGEARREARTALNRAAAIEWSATRRTLVGDGVPPWVLDLAEPVLSRPNELVVDLSNFAEDDINASEIIRDLVEGYKGTVDLSDPAGHEGSDSSDPDKAVLDRFTAETSGL